MPRYSLDITAEERDQLKAMAMASERSMAGMMKIVFRSGLHVWKAALESRQNHVEPALGLRQSEAESEPGNVAPLIDACTGAGALVLSGSSSVPPSLPDPEGPDHGPETEPKLKPMPMWKTELQEPEAWSYIEKGLASWPKTGPLAAAGFDQLDAAKLLHTSWARRKDSNPIDMLNDADAQLEVWIAKRRKRRTKAEIRLRARQVFRTKAANTVEQEARQKIRIDKAIADGQAEFDPKNDDPLTEWDEAPWKKDKS